MHSYSVPHRCRHSQLNPILATTTIAFFAVSSVAKADLILNFSADNGFSFANEFEVQTGQALDLGVYLQQSAPDSVLSEEGLASWGFNLARDATQFGQISSRQANTEFASEQHDMTTANGFEWEFAHALGEGIVGDTIFLGQFRYEATAEGTTQFSIRDRIAGTGFENASWATPTLTFLDEQIFGDNAVNSFDFSVRSTAVPEPSSLILPFFLLGLARWRQPRIDSRCGI